MAFTAVVPVTLNPAITIGLAQAFQSPAVKDFAGAAVDLHEWADLTAKLVPLAPNPTSSEVEIGTVTASALGVVTLTTATADLTDASAGAARLVISGKPTGGDDPQVLVQGVATVSQS